MSLDFEAIFRAYTGQVVSIDDGAGAFDKAGNVISLDQAKIDNARKIIDAENAAIQYKKDRAKNYASIEEQLDMQYWDSVNGTTTWKDHVAKVKKDYPKP